MENIKQINIYLVDGSRYEDVLNNCEVVDND